MAIGINIVTDGPCMELTKDLFELIFPQGLFDWFELTAGRSDEQQVYFTLTEKDLPPLSNPNQTIVARKFHDVTITDFPWRSMVFTMFSTFLDSRQNHCMFWFHRWLLLNKREAGESWPH